ncbi:MAG TPA: MBL fold metallo-hydrolase [Candidatus Sulfotelmatobacter sp.]|nr:MBL fold metallo-hydrolase [Candidatus Sulfotelmatobacter sp.]HWI57193.1 MBL fold metallo-hydrolase [Bacillota bacterium]
MKNYSVKCFGTGDGCPCPDRNHAAFLYRLGKTSLLIDCGEPLDRNYKASGLSYDAFDGLLISHMHADHFGGFFMFMQGCWLEDRRKTLPVYLPKGAVKPVGQMLQSAFLFEEVLPFRLQLLPLPPQPITVGDVKVTPFRNSHLEGYRTRLQKQYRAADFSAFSFLLESGRRRIAHSADIGKPEDLEPLLAQPLDLLVCELAHFTPEQIFGYLQGRAIRQIIFVHVGRPFRQPLARIRRLAARKLPEIPHTFARDGQEISW